MTYRRLTQRQLDARARKLAAMQRGRDLARLGRTAQGRAPDLPTLRREVIVIDYDTGEPVTHTLHLYRTRRVDTYRIEADGKPWICACGLVSRTAGPAQGVPSGAVSSIRLLAGLEP